MNKDHGPSYEGQGVDCQPGDVPVSHKGPDIGELPHSLHHRSCQRQQLLVQLEPRPALQLKRASLSSMHRDISQYGDSDIPFTCKAHAGARYEEPHMLVRDGDENHNASAAVTCRTCGPSSRCSFFKEGKAVASSCRTMEALMYGTIPACHPVRKLIA